ncbi:unnamed protein product, partial [Symbiodinium sp. KB8]
MAFLSDRKEVISYGRAPDVAVKIGTWSCFCFCGAPSHDPGADDVLGYERSPSDVELVVERAVDECEDDDRPNFSGDWMMVKAEGDMDAFLKEMGVGYVMRTFASSFNYGVGVTSTLIEHKGSQLKITMKTPKGTSTSTIHINGTEQGSVDPMEDRPLRVLPQWEGKVLVVSSRRADSAESLPTNRRFLQGVQMIVESTTQSGLVTRRIF